MAHDDDITAVGRAMVPTMILLLLARGEQDRLMLVESLRGAGFWFVQAGTVYPHVRELESRGWIEATSDPAGSQHDAGRLRITDAGRARVRRQANIIEHVYLSFSNLTTKAGS